MYNLIIGILGKEEKLDAMKRMFDDMKNAGVSPTLNTYNVIAKCYGAWGHFDEMFQIIEEMKEKGVQPNILTHSIVLESYAKNGKVNEMEEYWKNLKNSSKRPNIAWYHALVDAWGSIGNFENLFGVLHSMEKDGVALTIDTHNKVLMNMGRKHKFLEMKRYFEWMKNNGIQPNNMTNGIVGVLKEIEKEPAQKQEQKTA